MDVDDIDSDFDDYDDEFYSEGLEGDAEEQVNSKAEKDGEWEDEDDENAGG